MQSYLIEFRFQSKRVNTYLRGMIYNINRKFRVGKRKHVPHISLVGPFTTNNERKLISDFARICSETELLKFKLRGFGTFDNNKVVYVNINASDRLNDFRIKLTNTLRKYCNVKSHDKKSEKKRFAYHSTIAMKLNENKFNQIKKYINSKSKPNYSQIVMRITLLKGGRILKEYDFMQRRLLNRHQSLNRHITRKSKELLRKFMRGQYQPKRKVRKQSKSEPQSIWKKIKSFFGN